MTTRFSADIDFQALYNYVLRELHEPENTGSEAVTLDLVKDTVNSVYAEVFNDQRIKPSARENDVSFTLANDTTLATDSAIGDLTLTLTDSSSFKTAGKVLLLSEFADYTANNLTDTLSGVTGLQMPHSAGEIVRQLYPLSAIASDIDEEQIQYLDVNGVIQNVMGYENLISQANFYPNTYGVYKKHIIFSSQSTVGGTSQLAKALMIYTQKITPMSATTDKPSLIPNQWRVPVLVYGACQKIAASDAFRTSWDYWKQEYDKALSQYIAFKNSRVRDVNNKRRPSIYSSYR